MHGGTANRGRVLRVGSTVHRPTGRHTEAVHALLAHLAATGFDGVPRVLAAFDDTEVLGYIDGRAANLPTPEWALTDDALDSVGVLLRDYHEHVAAFPGTGRAWQRAVPADWRGTLVTHNDSHPANIVFRDGRAVALIDFDLAAPGCVAWELAVAACFWAPLLDPGDVTDSRQGQSTRRFRLLADSYGAPADLRQDVVAATVAANGWIASIIEDAAADGHPAFASVWAHEAAKYRRAHDWLLQHQADLIRAAR